MTALPCQPPPSGTILAELAGLPIGGHSVTGDAARACDPEHFRIEGTCACLQVERAAVDGADSLLALRDLDVRFRRTAATVWWLMDCATLALAMVVNPFHGLGLSDLNYPTGLFMFWR